MHYTVYMSGTETYFTDCSNKVWDKYEVMCLCVLAGQMNKKNEERGRDRHTDR